jgi:hypothetical protein
MNTDRLNRREMLSVLMASGVALSLGTRSDAAGLPAIPATDRHVPFATEGVRLTQACLHHFWDKNSQMFRAPVLSSETVPSDALHDRGYTLWPSLIALHVLIEGEKCSPGQYKDQIAMVYDGLSQYYSGDLHAYTAWVHFPGNTDAYYDDNSWAVIVLVEASLACRKTDPTRSAQYLDRAKTVMADFVVNGSDTTGRPGGIRWGADPSKPNTSDRGTSSTAGSALAALMLARAGVDPKFYTQWGHDLLLWLSTRLVDTDGLVMDALVPPDWKARTIKWTYNTGVPMRAYVEHYRLTKSADSLSRASQLANAAINRDGALFDSAVHDPHKRFYWDESYFVHYLIDGLLQVAEVTTDAELASAAVDTAVRSADYAQAYLCDPADGFYWRNWRLYAIGEAQHDTWQTWTGQTVLPAYDASERSQEAQFQTLAVKDRPLVKTLLANAGMARLFWLVSRTSQHGRRQMILS